MVLLAVMVIVVVAVHEVLLVVKFSGGGVGGDCGGGDGSRGHTFLAARFFSASVNSSGSCAYTISQYANVSLSCGPFLWDIDASERVCMCVCERVQFCLRVHSHLSRGAGVRKRKQKKKVSWMHATGRPRMLAIGTWSTPRRTWRAPWAPTGTRRSPGSAGECELVSVCDCR